MNVEILTAIKETGFYDEFERKDEYTIRRAIKQLRINQYITDYQYKYSDSEIEMVIANITNKGLRFLNDITE